MAAFTSDQLELLLRAREGVPMWGGSTALPRLARDVDLLLALGLVEPAEEWPYQVTGLGQQVLGALRPGPTSDSSGQDVGLLIVGPEMDGLSTNGP